MRYAPNSGLVPTSGRAARTPSRHKPSLGGREVQAIDRGRARQDAREVAERPPAKAGRVFSSAT